MERDIAAPDRALQKSIIRFGQGCAMQGNVSAGLQTGGPGGVYARRVGRCVRDVRLVAHI